MIKYELKDNVVAHFPAIFKGLGSNSSVIHLALDVELLGGVLVARVAGGRPIHCGKCSRSTIIELARELVRRKHRVVLVEEACGFGYRFHRQLREIGVEAHVVATEMLNRKRKTNRRDAARLLDQLYDFDVNGHKKALRPIRVPTLVEQKKRRLCRMRSQMIKVRSIMEGQGRGLLFDFDFHEVPPGWWGARKWPKLRAKLLAHDPWLIEMLEHHQRLLIAQQRRINQLEGAIARESNYDARQVARGLGETTFASLQREAIDWKRFQNAKQIGSYIGCCPSEFSTGANQKLGSIDRMGNRRMRTLLVEAVWRSSRMFLARRPLCAELRGKKRWSLVLACWRSICGDSKPAESL